MTIHFWPVQTWKEDTFLVYCWRLQYTAGISSFSTDIQRLSRSTLLLSSSHMLLFAWWMWLFALLCKLLGVLLVSHKSVQPFNLPLWLCSLKAVMSFLFTLDVIMWDNNCPKIREACDQDVVGCTPKTCCFLCVWSQDMVNAKRSAGGVLVLSCVASLHLSSVCPLPSHPSADSNSMRFAAAAPHHYRFDGLLQYVCVRACVGGTRLQL